MKKILSLFSVLIFSLVLIAGCGGGGGGTTVATTSGINLSGAIPSNIVKVNSPGKNMEISVPTIPASDLLIEAVDENESSLTPAVTTNPATDGTYTLKGVPANKVIFVRAKIKSTGKALLKKYVGKLAKPTEANPTITGINLDDDSTAKAIVVEELLKNSSDKNLIGALKKPIIPKSGNAATILADYQKIVTDTVKQALGDALSSNDTDPSTKIYKLKNKIKNLLEAGTSITGEINLSNVDSTLTGATLANNAKTFVDNYMSVPTGLEIGGKSVGLNSDNIEVTPDSQYHNIRGAVVFNKNIDLSKGYVVLKVSVTNNGIVKNKIVYSKNAPSIYSNDPNGITWEEAFGYTLGNLPYESPNKISMDFQEQNKFNIETGSIVSVEVIFSGITDKDHGYPIVMPSDFDSTFTFTVK